MFGVVETFTVLGGISAMVSAYKDAGGRFRFWKSKKQKTKVGPESAALEASLHHVPNDLWRQCERGSSLGLPFENGDDIAKQSVLNSLLNFNKTLLECLQKAISRGHEPDLSHLLHTSESTGRETNSILKDLYQRVLQAKRIPRDLSPPPLPLDATQKMHDMIWEEQTGTTPDRMSVISRNSSIRSSSSTSTSEDVLQANLERLAQHSVQRMPSTSMNAVVSRHASFRSASSADVLRRNKTTLSR